MNIYIGKRLSVVAAVLAAVAIFATGFFVALGVRSVVAGPGSAPAAQVPPVSHTYDQIELPPATWTGLDADTLDGRNFDEIDDADDHVASADHATTADSATSAGTASTANSATTASYATTAGDADTVDGYHGSELAGWPAGHYCIVRAIKQGDSASTNWVCPAGFSETGLIFDDPYAVSRATASHPAASIPPAAGWYGLHGIRLFGYFHIRFCCK